MLQIIKNFEKGQLIVTVNNGMRSHSLHKSRISKISCLLIKFKFSTYLLKHIRMLLESSVVNSLVKGLCTLQFFGLVSVSM